MQESFLARIFVAYQSIYVKLKPKCSPDYSANIVKYISTANLHTVQDIFLTGSLFLSHASNCVKMERFGQLLFSKDVFFDMGN